MIRRVIYTSNAVAPFSRRELLDLLHDARDYNRADNITGLLLHDHGQFLQVIEGPVEKIESLVVRLSKDTRHTNFQIQGDVKVKERLFPTWAMGLGDLSDPSLSFLPGMIPADDERHRLFLLADRLPELAEHLHTVLGKS